MTVEYVTAKLPNMNVLMYADKNHPYISSIETVLNQELISRYFNPQWIQGMMLEGYSGARYMSNKFTNNLLGWQVTRPSAVENWMWDSIVDVYVNDKYGLGVNDWLKSGNNAYSYISMTGTLLTAAYEGYWKTDSATLNKIANEWAQAILNNGVACCDCSCGNIAMMEWAIDYINPDMLAQFKQVMLAATHNNLFAQSEDPIPSDPTDNPSSGSSSESSNGDSGSNSIQSNFNSTSSSSDSADGQSPGISVVSAAQAQSGSSASPGDSGNSAHEITKSSSSSFSPTEVGMSIVAIIAVIIIVLIVGFGYQRKKGDDF